MTRQTKTPAQRAQEQYDLAGRVADRLVGKASAAKKTYDDLVEQRDAAIRRRDYLAQHPDLPEQPSTPANQSGDTTR